MAKLRKQIKSFAPARESNRATRSRNQVPSVVIAGYTNAGKSSLLNALTSSNALVENALFATLDTTVRKSKTADGRAFTITDTVGFVRNLPHELIEAFRSTLEEVERADLILHVVDAAHPDPASQISTVRNVIGELGASQTPELVVFNKSDLVDEGTEILLRGLVPSALFVSARTGDGLPALQAKIAELLPHPSIRVELLIPYSQGSLLATLHSRAEVLNVAHTEQGSRVSALVEPRQLDYLDAYRIQSEL